MTSVNYETVLPPRVEPPARGRGRWAGRVNGRHALLAALLYAFFAVFLVWPIFQVVYTGFVAPDGSLTVRYVALIFESPVLREGLANATIVAVLVTFVTLLIALPLAMLSVRYEFRGRALLGGLLLVPLVLPPFVGGIGVRFLLSRHGPLTQLVGAGPEGIDWLGSYRLAGIVLVE